jgi:thiamine kinase-like enzyme
LVDSLTGNDKNYAIAALQRFMKRLGQFHSDSYENIQIYQKILDGLIAGAPPEIDSRQNNFTDVESVFKKINIPYTSEFQAEMDMVLKTNLDSSPFLSFIHGDICPDNVFDDSDKNELRLIDFEWGFIRSALLDGTYLRMNMPTCWCSKAIPEDLIDSLEEIYRQELMNKIPAARNEESYREAYILACGFWAIKAILLIEDVLDKEDIWGSGPISDKSLWNPDENFVRPRILSRFETFMQISKQSDKLPQLKIVIQQILGVLAIKWPDTKPLELYPAFRTKL